jgi:hypothetical protein
MKLLAAFSHKLFMNGDSMKTRDNSLLRSAGSTTTTVAFIKLKPCTLERLCGDPPVTVLPCPVLSQASEH